MSIIALNNKSHKTGVAKGIKTEDVKALRAAGFSSTRIASMLGISPGTVGYHLAKPVTTAVNAPSAKAVMEKAVVEKMLRLREQGMSNSQIAAQIGCCYQTVWEKIGRQPQAISTQNRSRALSAYRAKLAVDKEAANAITNAVRHADESNKEQMDVDTRTIAINVLRFVAEALTKAISDVEKG